MMVSLIDCSEHCNIEESEHAFNKNEMVERKKN